MKLLKSFSLVAIFLFAVACTENPKDKNTSSTTTSEGDSNRDTSAKNITINDTLKTPGVESGATKNNPDITK